MLYRLLCSSDNRENIQLCHTVMEAEKSKLTFNQCVNYYSDFLKPIEVWTKWRKFCRRHLKNIFLNDVIAFWYKCHDIFPAFFVFVSQALQLMN